MLDFAIQRFQLRYEQGRVAEAEETLAGIIATAPSLVPGRASGKSSGTLASETSARNLPLTLGRIRGIPHWREAVNLHFEDMISVTEANNRGVSRLVNDATQGRPQVLLRNSKAVAAVVGIDTVERLQRLDDLEGDLRLLSVALARTVADSGRRYDLEEVAAEFGVDPNDLDDD